MTSNAAARDAYLRRLDRRVNSHLRRKQPSKFKENTA